MSMCVCVCVRVCVCLCVCPAFTTIISLAMGLILMKLDGNVGTLVRLIVFDFTIIYLNHNGVIPDSFFFVFIFAKGQNSATKGNNDNVVS